MMTKKYEAEPYAFGTCAWIMLGEEIVGTARRWGSAHRPGGYWSAFCAAPDGFKRLSDRRFDSAQAVADAWPEIVREAGR